MKKSNSPLLPPDLDYKPYIVYDEHLQVWVGLRDGGRIAVFSYDYDDAKPLYYEQQFKTLQRIVGYKLEKEYLK
jgi:hypothetical protein